MADLSEFYPAPAQPSLRGDGAPASPGAAASRPASIGGAPAMWVLGLVALSLFLMHKG